MQIKTETLIKVFGSKSEVAKFFGCHRQGVQQWGEFIPALRAYHLKERRPDIVDDIAQGKYS